MEKTIRGKFSEGILQEAMLRFGIASSAIHELGGFESFVYEYEKEDRHYILRISHSSRRTAELIHGEVDWINYLSDSGVSACRAILSDGGQLVEQIPVDDTYFAAVSFEKAKGSPAGPQAWNAPLFKKMGRMAGRMHSLAKEYKLRNPTWKRPEWHEEVTGTAERYLPDTKQTIIAKFNQLQHYLHSLPKSRESFGLVHIDFHRGNFFVKDGEIYLFDFDDCQYSWFADDIAIALFYAIPHHCESAEDRKSAQCFFDTFMEGYILENRLDPKWLKQIPYFLKQREIDLYIIIHRSFDLDDLDDWCSSYMKNRKHKIENDIPYVDIPFG